MEILFGASLSSTQHTRIPSKHCCQVQRIFCKENLKKHMCMNFLCVNLEIQLNFAHLVYSVLALLLIKETV